MNKPNKKETGLAKEEMRSEEFLIEKMGLAKKELEQIKNQYGVSASQIVELMQFGKYQL